MKVIIHISELDRWSVGIANAKNLLEIDNTVLIEIHANSEAVRNYVNLTNQHFESLNNLSLLGVKLVACKNSMLANAISDDKIPNFVTIVPAVIMELTIKQLEGYAYIKP